DPSYVLSSLLNARRPVADDAAGVGVARGNHGEDIGLQRVVAGPLRIVLVGLAPRVKQALLVGDVGAIALLIARQEHLQALRPADLGVVEPVGVDGGGPALDVGFGLGFVGLFSLAGHVENT